MKKVFLISMLGLLFSGCASVTYTSPLGEKMTYRRFDPIHDIEIGKLVLKGEDNKREAQLDSYKRNANADLIKAAIEAGVKAATNAATP